MAADVDFEALGLLDGLEGDARQERVELIAWLLDRGFELDHIRGSVGAPLNLPANRVIGDDGSMCPHARYAESTGIDWTSCSGSIARSACLESRIPTRRTCLRADGEAAAQARIILDLGIDPEDVIAVLRVMSESLGHAAAVMREAALKTILKPGATEIEVAEAIEALALRAAPTFGPMMEALLRLELRRSFETEAVTAAERAAGILPGARRVTVCFADLTGFTRLGEALPPEDLERVANRLAELAHDVSPAPVRFVKSIGDAVMLVCFEPAPLVVAVLDLMDAAAANDLPPPSGRRRNGLCGDPGRGLVRQSGQCGEPGDGGGATGCGARRGVDPGRHRQCGGFRVVVDRCATPQGVSGEVKLFRVQRAVTRFT